MIGSTKKYLYQVYQIKEKIDSPTEKIYYGLENYKGQFLGYVSETAVSISEKPVGVLKEEEQYVSINSKKDVILADLDYSEGKSTSEYYGKVFRSEGVIETFDGKRYLLLKDNKEKIIGYVNENAIKSSPGGQGFYQSYGDFVTIISGNYDIWQNFNWEKRNHSSDYKGQTLQARGYYEHFNGSRYLSLYDSKGKWVGYIDEAGTKVANNRGGVYQSYGKYVKIKSKNYDIWQDFNWKKRSHSSKYYGQTLQARGYYHHFNGARYLSLYDTKGKWVGYINETGTELTNPQGKHHSYGKYVSIKSKNYDIWQNFDWKKRNHSSDYYGQSLQARGYYDHFNGSRYLSLYDSKGKWVGYINETGTQLSNNGVSSVHQRYGKYVTIKTKNVGIWQNFNWKQRANSTSYYGKPLEARGYYVHFNGKKYFSLYDNKGKWIGYINEDNVETNNSNVGFYQRYGKQVILTSKNYDIWQNFNWKKRDHSSNYYGQELEARGVYEHFNGGRYLSLYDKSGKWIGYINQTGTKDKPIVKDKMDKVQKLLDKSYKSSNYGIYVMSLVDGSVAQKNGSKVFTAASTGKLPALYYTQKMILDGKRDGNKLYTYTDAINRMPLSYMRGGAGILQGKRFGTQYSLNTIMNWTAKYSDNQGTNFLAYHAANQYDSVMKKEISNILGRSWTTPFRVSAKDNALLMKAIHNQGGKLINDLSNTVYDSQRIPKYIPNNVKVAHKIGDLNGYAHDAAIVYADQPYVIVVMTQNVGYEPISKLSKQVYDILK